MLICPHCSDKLVRAEQQYCCSQQHTFDIGKGGDVNLLLPQQKRSKQPGDSKAMVAARRDFLSSGVYQPIAELLAKTVMMISAGQPCVIADAGCGEGYYLRRVQQLAFPQLDFFQRYGGQLIGWDISKYAVQSAAKQSSMPSTWVTASNAAIPLANDSVDILFSCFGFEVEAEFTRIVKSGGYIVTLDVGEQHLIELRQRIYPVLKPYKPKPTLTASKVKMLKENQLYYNVGVNTQQLAQLMLMTPHFYRATSEAKMALNEIRELSVSIDIMLRIYHVG